MTFDAAPGYLSADDCRLADLIDLVSQKTDPADYPYASAVEQNVLIYDGARLRKQLSRPACRPRVETELARALLDGPGIVVLAGTFDDPWVIDRATWQFEAIIAAQRVAGGAAGDHFAAAGQNDRIWNALEKLALRAPEVFADYYANDLIATVCRGLAGTRLSGEANYVQLPLCKGDAVFFNPALFHAAGANRTADVRRMANLLQVSSALGRAMEAVDRAAMSAAVSPALQSMADDGHRRRRSPTSSRRAPKAIRSPPTSTWSSPSTGSRRAPRLTSSAGPCQNNGHGSSWSSNSMRGAPAARPGGTPTPRRRSADDQLR